MKEQPLEILHTNYGEIIDMNPEKKQTKEIVESIETIKKPIFKEKKTPFFFSFFPFLRKKNK